MMFETVRVGAEGCRRVRRQFLGLGAFLVLAGLYRGLAAQERERAPAVAARPSYPRTNLSTGYEPVASWPARPREMTWGAMAGIAISPSGQIWTFNRGPVPVQVYTADGELVSAWGQGRFREPHQVRIDRDGFVWLVDSGMHVVRKFTPDGKLLLTLGTPGEPGEDSAHLNRPTDLAVAPDGNIFVTDGYGNNRIVHFDGRGHFARTWGSLGPEPGQFSLPHSIALDSRGRLFVADRNNARVQVFDQEGRFLAEWRDLLVPWHIVITDGDEIYVCGSSPMRWPVLPIPGLVVGIPPKDQLIMVFTPDGRVTRLCTFPKGQHPGEVDWVHAMAVDRQGNLYLGDIQGKRVQKFLRLEPMGRVGEVATKVLPRRDEPVRRAGKP
jgi:DNA-binding beta-propeller fold protein YncE